LGVTPRNNTEGCLQDVHWATGLFGYFPSYCLGNMIAAQLWYAVHKEIPAIEEDFAIGKFDRLLGWLRTHVHCKGRRLETEELLEEVTGEKISPKYLLKYLSERYGPLYLR
jgi:carboxypeptidase Taq